MKTRFILIILIPTLFYLNSCKKKSTTSTGVDSTLVGLIAYYPFNNNGLDISGKNHNASSVVNVSPVADRFGVANSAYLFSGNSYLIVPDDSTLRLSNTDYTLNYWVNLTAYSSTYGIVPLSKRGVGTSNGWITGISGPLAKDGISGRNDIAISGGADPIAYGNTVIPLSAWRMITITFSLKTKTISIYVNGVLDNTISNIPSPNSTTNTPMVIGGDSQGSVNPNVFSYFFTGVLDDIRIYNRKISQGNISLLFNKSTGNYSNSIN